MIIDNPYVSSGSLCEWFLFQKYFSKELQVLLHYQYTNNVLGSLKGERCPLHTTLVPKKITYLSNQFQSFLHRLRKNIHICVLIHSHRYFGFFLGIISISDSPDRKQLSPSQIFSLTNIASPTSVHTIWIPIIIINTIVQIWLDHWAENIHINIKHVISRLRFIVNNFQIFIIWLHIPMCLC